MLEIRLTEECQRSHAVVVVVVCCRSRAPTLKDTAFDIAGHTSSPLTADSGKITRRNSKTHRFDSATTYAMKSGAGRHALHDNRGDESPIVQNNHKCGIQFVYLHPFQINRRQG